MEDADKKAMFQGERDYKKSLERGAFSRACDNDYHPPQGHKIAYDEGRKRAQEDIKKSQQ